MYLGTGQNPCIKCVVEDSVLNPSYTQSLLKILLAAACFHYLCRGFAVAFIVFIKESSESSWLVLPSCLSGFP